MWVVVMNGADKPVVYGPMEGGIAAAFAGFLTAEVDPAVAVPLADPVAELLGWRESIADPALSLLADIRAAEANPGPEGTAAKLAGILARPYPGEPS